jgi:hypothetical protein
MASAVQLNATATITSGHGLGVSSDLLSQISTYQNQAPVKTLANIFANVSGASYDVQSNINSIIGNLGVGVTNGTQWLIDLYAGNVTPVSNGGVQYYLTTSTPIYSLVGMQEVITGYTTTPVTSTASFSKTLTSQASIPFANGIAGFANVYGTASAYASSTFDTVSSLHMLQNKTYAQSGIGFTGPMDLTTQGIGSNGWIISSAVSSWGTMYDISNINSIGNVYVFGQNLLNQGLGNYGGLSTSLENAGLDISNLLAPIKTVNSTTHDVGTVTTGSILGNIEYPTTTVTTTTNSPTGLSSQVLMSVFSGITGANLNAIISATGITNTTGISSLADFLTLRNVVPPSTYTALSSAGVTTLSQFGGYMQSKIGQGFYTSWTQLSNFVSSIEVPQLYNTVTTASTQVLASSTISSISSAYGSGSGPFNNIIISDMLGACAGIPYTAQLQVINTTYPTLSTAINLPTLINTLNTAVNTYISTLNSAGSASTTPVANAVNAINSALTTAGSHNQSAVTTGAAAYFTMTNHLTTEYSNVTRAGVVFNSGYQSILSSFASQIGTTASDKTQYQNYQFFANVMTHDAYGDTLRLAVAESINTSGFNSVGFPMNNDPSPTGAIMQSQLQNIPLTTYINQNQ